MSAFYRAIRYLKHFFKAGNAHSIHSPFVFEFYRAVTEKGGSSPLFREIEGLRQRLLEDSRIVHVTDFGAGAGKASGRKVAEIARRSLKSPAQAQLLFKIVEFLNPRNILELGTSLGITTLYLSSARKDASVFTFEGCKKTLSIASENFRELPSGNINCIEGNLDETLSSALKDQNQVDLVYFDANHRYQPTMEYFKLCLSKAHPGTVFIFDDIYWSKEMAKAWEDIKVHSSVTLSIDLYHFGLVFFRTNAPKQHFRLK